MKASRGVVALVLLAAWGLAQVSGAVVGISQWKVLGLWTVLPMAIAGLQGSFAIGIVSGIPLWLGAAGLAVYFQKLNLAVALAALGVFGPWSLLLFSFPNC